MNVDWHTVHTVISQKVKLGWYNYKWSTKGSGLLNIRKLGLRNAPRFFPGPTSGRNVQTQASFPQQLQGAGDWQMFCPLLGGSFSFQFMAKVCIRFHTLYWRLPTLTHMYNQVGTHILLLSSIDYGHTISIQAKLLVIKLRLSVVA